jgi:hypothetical protein
MSSCHSYLNQKASKFYLIKVFHESTAILSIYELWNINDYYLNMSDPRIAGLNVIQTKANINIIAPQPIWTHRLTGYMKKSQQT